jgi:hypothetical protein
MESIYQAIEPMKKKMGMRDKWLVKATHAYFYFILFYFKSNEWYATCEADLEYIIKDEHSISLTF